MAALLPASVSTEELIPDFCRWRALLLLAFILELVAIVLTLAGAAGPDLMNRLMLTSLYLQWTGFCAAAVLCTVRQRLRHVPARVVFPACWLLLVGVTLAVSAIGYEVLWGGAPAVKAPETRASFMFRHGAIGAVVSLLVLNYFWLQHQWRQQLRAESESRYQALQARIRPHFLFNSLNSIAALVAVRPEDAEVLIEDLSELMRASLEVRSRLVPLEDELALARAYLRIEQARLGERLKVEWDVPDDAAAMPVPLLSVQPLVENAIYHGLERITGAGTVSVMARRTGAGLQVEIGNPRPPAGADPARSGQRMAVNNIAQRLALIYGEQARLELGEEGERYVARLKLPAIIDTSPESA